jgi:enoyl-[acyl-carrier-protein] reductase (NADH)
MPKLEGKVAVVTGGSSGIGLATAQRFVEEGAFVYITGRRQAELDKAVSEIGRNVTAIQGDVSNLADLDRLYTKVGEGKGKFDISSPVRASSTRSRSPKPRRNVSTGSLRSTLGGWLSLSRRPSRC